MGKLVRGRDLGLCCGGKAERRTALACQIIALYYGPTIARPEKNDAGVRTEQRLQSGNDGNVTEIFIKWGRNKLFRNGRLQLSG